MGGAGKETQRDLPTRVSPENLVDSVCAVHAGRLRKALGKIDEPIGIPKHTEFRRVDIPRAVVIRNDTDHVRDAILVDAVPAKDLFGDGRPFHLLIPARRGAVLSLGLMDADIVKNRGRLNHHGIASLNGPDAIRKSQHIQSMVDPLPVVAEEGLHIRDQLIRNSRHRTYLCRIMVNTILKRSSAATACGTLAGMIMICPAETTWSSPSIVSRPAPSIT